MSYYGDSRNRSLMNNLRYDIQNFIEEIQEIETKSDAIMKLLTVVKDVIGDELYDDCCDTDCF